MSAALEYARALAGAGYPVFPCYPRDAGVDADGVRLDKRPLVSGWRTLTAADAAANAAGWWSQWPNALIAVPTGGATGLWVVDLDVRPEEDKDGGRALAAASLALPPTRVHHTSRGGAHHLYRAPPGAYCVTNNNTVAPGVDLKGDGGYIIWWPAHGGVVTDGPFAAVPDWMLRYTGREGGMDGPAPDPLGLDDDAIDELLAMVPPSSMGDRGPWIRLGMALHHETEGDLYGLQVWTDWSSRWPKYDGPEACEREWRTFGRGRRAAVTMRSYIPRGWRPGLPTAAQAFAGGAALSVQPAHTVAQGLPAIPMREPALPQGMRDARDGTAQTRPLTEHGNALRLYDQHGQDLRYVTDAKAWLVWANDAWTWDTDGAIPTNLANGLYAGIYAEGAGNIHEADSYVKWARKTQELRVGKASVAILSSMHPMRIGTGLIDNNPMLVGLDRGRRVIDLATGVVRPATREDLVTKTLGVAGVGDPAGCHRWLRFLDQVFGGNRELIDWIQRWCGYVLTGDVREQFFCFAYGRGRNGKGTFTEFLRHLLAEYAAPVGIETLMGMRRSAGSAAPDVAALVGLRLAFSTETNDEAAMAEGLLKALTGGDSISTRQLYGKQFSFMPQFKLFVAGNHKPIIRGTDIGVWSRVRLIPFVRTFSLAEQDKTLMLKLKAEAEDILAWMVQGCLRWQQVGLSDVPLAVAEATESYREEMDDFGNWLDECCDATDPSRETPSSNLYHSYKEWAKNSGHVRWLTMQQFARKMIDRGFIKHRTNKNNRWIAISLRINGQ